MVPPKTFWAVFFYSIVMKLFDQIKDIGERIKVYLESEKELLRLWVVKKASSIVGNIFSFIIILFILDIALALVGIWLGFWLSDITGSYAIGFGLSAITFLILMLLLLIFRKPLLVRPFMNLAVRTMVEEENLPDENKEH